MRKSESMSELMHRDGSYAQFPSCFRFFASGAPVIKSKVQFHSIRETIEVLTERFNVWPAVQHDYPDTSVAVRAFPPSPEFNWGMLLPALRYRRSDPLGLFRKFRKALLLPTDKDHRLTAPLCGPAGII